MTTHDALLAAVLANPADDLPRLVYADYIEENGETKRAEFIRVQCRLHKWDFGSPAEHGSGILREREMFWRAPSPMREWFGVVGQDVNLFLGSDTSGINSTILASFIVRRGFVAEVTCTLSQWVGGQCPTCGGWTFDTIHDERTGRTDHVNCPQCNATGKLTGIGPAVVRSHPVEVVRVSDREPWEHVLRFAWWAEDLSEVGTPMERSGIPAEVYNRLTGYIPPFSVSGVSKSYPTAEDARAALSSALISWAKSQPHPARITSSPVSVDVTG